MFVSGTTLTQSSSGQYTSAWSSVGRYVRTKLSQRARQKNTGTADSFTWVRAHLLLPVSL